MEIFNQFIGVTFYFIFLIAHSYKCVVFFFLIYIKFLSFLKKYRTPVTSLYFETEL